MLATLAPVFGSLGLWALTSSPFALMFAALGPVIAIASVGDARMTARRTRRRESARFARDCESAWETIRIGHLHERNELSRLAPGARVLLTAASHDPEQWRGRFGEPVVVCLGIGVVPSPLDVQDDETRFRPPVLPASDARGRRGKPGRSRLGRDGRQRRGRAGGDAHQRLAELREAAASVTHAPVLVDARLGIGVCGPMPLALAAARAITVQLAAVLSPETASLTVRASGDQWRWLDCLPHEVARLPTAAMAGPDVQQVAFEGAESGSALVAVAESAELLPRNARVVVRAGASQCNVVSHPDGKFPDALKLEFVTAEEAFDWARRQSDRADALGLLAGRASLAEAVDLSILLEPNVPGVTATAAAVGLVCAIGLAADGPVSVDLVRDGPHAVVGGTTGSGKSELLVSWVIAMAAHRSPEVVSFLFVDFKGGASFAPLVDLPHTVGVITDLDTREALRALVSLRAEVRHRERGLAGAGLRSIDDAAPGAVFPRLVIVVDEYAAMVVDYPELSALFTDLAARGRSLGIHVILSTQRPAGVIREGILANCGLRLSLRVNNRADSVTVLGTDAAAALPARPPGRAVVVAAAGAPVHFQVAITSPADVRVVTERWAAAPRPRRPWCRPLPHAVSPGDLRALDDQPDLDGNVSPVGPPGLPGNLPFALADLPMEQRQAVARYDPRGHGHLLIVGGGRSGKSGVLRALEAAPTAVVVQRIRPDLASAWDALTGMLRDNGPRRLILLDDVDALVAAAPEDWAAPVLDLLGRALREGPAHGAHLVLTVQRLSGAVQSAAALCGSTLLLRMPNRREHLLAGGEPAEWADDLAVGAGFWRGARIQVVRVDQVDGESLSWQEPHARAVEAAGSRTLAAVSSQPARLADDLRRRFPGRSVVDITAAGDPRRLVVARGGEAGILVGDPEAWQAHWGALAALRSTSDVLLEGVTAAEFRVLTGCREIPPPPAPGETPRWLLTPDGELTRARLAPIGEKLALP